MARSHLEIDADIPHPRRLLMRKWTAKASKNPNASQQAQFRPRRCDLDHTAAETEAPR
jgi:hypothetical protein